MEQDGPMQHSQAKADCGACPIEAGDILEMHQVSCSNWWKYDNAA
jgi:hypothetical protein